MGLKQRGLVFATFFGSCIAIAFLLASLTTNQWVYSKAVRTNSTKATGEINYGLFSGIKSLDVGYGMRSTPINVFELVNNEPNLMDFWLWLGAAAGTASGLITSAVGAITSVLKAASAAKKRVTMVLLFVANWLSIISHIIAFVCWLVQFIIYLKHNVLPSDDLKINWHTRGLASLGLSFYFVIISMFFVMINICILTYVHLSEKREQRFIDQPDEDKTNAIMLY